MIANFVIPSPPDSGEQPFEIGSTLTLFDAAMIGGDRHPLPRFLADGTIDDHFEFLKAGIPPQPKSNKRADARRSLDVYHELMNLIRQDKLEPVSRKYQPSGEIDPVRTLIQTSDIIALALERGEQPIYLRSMDEPAPANELSVSAVTASSEQALPIPPAAQALEPLTIATSTCTASIVQVRKKRGAPDRKLAEQALVAIYKGNIPDYAAEPNKIVLKNVIEWLKENDLRAVSYPTILRAAGRRK